jgi:CDGSH-type Zn-finger protein/mannose-6-phosphate isomerase-like protein (cupin superfamily)
MATPTIANRKGYYYELKAGKRYFWCQCGLSKTQPFCDGSHAGTEFLPVMFKAEKDDEVIFCGCKQTLTPPFCDGTHNNLPGGYVVEDPNSPENLAVRTVEPSDDPVVMLDGGCYLFATARARLTRHGALAYCPVISPSQGSLYQSQFYAELDAGETSPVISADGRHTVLFIRDGEGEVEVSGRRFQLSRYCGIYVKPDEAFRVRAGAGETMKFFISNGPTSDDLVFIDDMPDAFGDDFPNRLAEIDPAQRHSMAARYYQILVNREHGSTMVTQFIGNIPLSKGESHRHLYEESIIFLGGEGAVWTEDKKVVAGPGDVLFLPRKQLHSVQCTSESGIDLVGLIYPGDNPSVNY